MAVELRRPAKSARDLEELSPRVLIQMVPRSGKHDAAAVRPPPLGVLK